MAVRFECVFECELRRSIGIDRFARIRFGNRNFDGNAVNGAGRGENKMADSGVDGGVQKSERARDIVAEIFARVGDGFSHITMSGEVHDGVDPRQNLVEFGLVSDVALDEFEALGQAAEAGGEIVVDDDFITGSAQCASGVTADVTRASYD